MRRRHTVILILLAGAGIIVAGTVLVRWQGREAAWMTRASMQLKQIHQTILINQKEFRSPPNSTLLLVTMDYFSPRLLFAPHSPHDPSNVFAGDRSYEQLFGDDADIKETRRFLKSLEPPSGWERLGDFYVLREEIWRQDGQCSVVACSIPCPLNQDLRVIVYCDNHVGAVEGDTWIAAENEHRASWGLDPLPPLPPP